jgi:DNA-binding NtrC family response regulator
MNKKVNGFIIEVNDHCAVADEFARDNLIGNSTAFLNTLAFIKKVARCDAPVLLRGETGTGKEMAARAIHYFSPRRDQPFIAVNCGAFPDDLIENELFGHQKGAFTDARENQLGLVAQANGGTLFLDEVDSLSAKAQVVLLRFLQDHSYRALGSQNQKTANVRIVAASNADLQQRVDAELFRQDLLFRLDILSVNLPPLRDRIGDITLLAHHFARRYAALYQQPPRRLHADMLNWMERYAWPGNVRQLENFIQRALLLAEEDYINAPPVDNNTVVSGPGRSGLKVVDIGTAAHAELGEIDPLRLEFNEAKSRMITCFEKEYLRRLMATTHGNVTLAARRAGKERRALGKLLKKHGIERSDYAG